jgi:hypothetical protein
MGRGKKRLETRKVVAMLTPLARYNFGTTGMGCSIREGTHKSHQHDGVCRFWLQFDGLCAAGLGSSRLRHSGWRSLGSKGLSGTPATMSLFGLAFSLLGLVFTFHNVFPTRPLSSAMTCLSLDVISRSTPLKLLDLVVS